MVFSRGGKGKSFWLKKLLGNKKAKSGTGSDASRASQTLPVVGLPGTSAGVAVGASPAVAVPSAVAAGAIAAPSTEAPGAVAAPSTVAAGAMAAPSTEAPEPVAAPTTVAAVAPEAVAAPSTVAAVAPEAVAAPSTVAAVAPETIADPAVAAVAPEAVAEPAVAVAPAATGSACPPPQPATPGGDLLAAMHGRGGNAGANAAINPATGLARRGRAAAAKK